jgi:hypothetical protein
LRNEPTTAPKTAANATKARGSTRRVYRKSRRSKIQVAAMSTSVA